MFEINETPSILIAARLLFFFFFLNLWSLLLNQGEADKRTQDTFRDVHLKPWMAIRFSFTP